MTSTSTRQQQQPEAGPPLLAVDPRRLRGEEEMRRIFGARILREEELENAAAGGDSLISFPRQLHCPHVVNLLATCRHNRLQLRKLQIAGTRTVL